MSDSRPAVKHKRQYGHSCIPCREKKIQCDAQRPRCSGCIRAHEDCSYRSARPLRKFTPSHTIGNTVRDNGPAGSSLSPGFEGARHVCVGPTGQCCARLLSDRLTKLEELIGVIAEGRSRASSPIRVRARDRRLDDEAPRFSLRVDDSGNIACYGATGFWQGSDLDREVQPTESVPASSLADPTVRQFYEAFASNHHDSVPPEFGRALVRSYFSFQVFDIVDRTLFIRDMALGGPFFSEFLLMAIYAAGIRMMDGIALADRVNQSDMFAQMAKKLLWQELDGPSKITTIQGLLILSGRECAMGAPAQGWTHAGMAFRLIHDLGIHLPPNKIAGHASLSSEDKAAREHIFWSAMIWDKCISLSLGREPTFPMRHGHDPDSIQDSMDDNDLWEPYFVDPANRPISLLAYPPIPPRRSATFRAFAKLCLILHDIIIQLYCSEVTLDTAGRTAFRSKARRRLEELYESMQRSNIASDGSISPPPWIFMLLMMYHASWILLYRPMLEGADTGTPEDIAICQEHNAAIRDMGVSYNTTFARRMPYVAMYSAFVAMSFDVGLLRNPNPGQVESHALARFQEFYETLTESAAQGPGIRASLQQLVDTAAACVARRPVLADSEAGRWLLVLHSQHHSEIITTINPEFLTGDLDFLQLLGEA